MLVRWRERGDGGGAFGQVIATGSNDQRLAIVREQGADLVVNLASDDFVSVVKGVTDGRGGQAPVSKTRPATGEIVERPSADGP